jgi:hypothetical protein
LSVENPFAAEVRFHGIATASIFLHAVDGVRVQAAENKHCCCAYPGP